ncbi:MAG: hypothetical protein LC799_34695 [Actinobacteria bacterium]|nr:hypothetical protein [Actinomycetota bacterium]
MGTSGPPRQSATALPLALLLAALLALLLAALLAVLLVHPPTWQRAVALQRWPAGHLAAQSPAAAPAVQAPRQSPDPRPP